MALFRRLTMLAGAAEAARRYAQKNPDKVAGITSKAARIADQRTHGKYRRQIDNAVRTVDGLVGGRGHGGQHGYGQSGQHGYGQSGQRHDRWDDRRYGQG